MSAPLQAYTESAQRRLGPKKQPKKEPVRKHHAGKKTKLSFDDAARHEYLTGFSKRKQARKQAAHDFVQAKIREEIRESRRAARDARKERAAENVAAEKAYYAQDGDDYDEEDEQGAPVADVAPLSKEHEFEGDDRRARVTVQSFDVDDAPAAIEPSVPAPKKEKAAPQKRTKKSVPPPQSGSLTGILEPDVASAAQSGQLFDDDEVVRPAPKKEKFTYTTAAERAAERMRIRRRNHEQAEKRRAENRTRAVHKRGSAKR